MPISFEPEHFAFWFGQGWGGNWGAVGEKDKLFSINNDVAQAIRSRQLLTLIFSKIRERKVFF